MLTLEWIRVADHEFEKGRSYLVKWGKLHYFLPDDTKVVLFSELGNWILGGEVIKAPDYVFPINLMKHRVAPETFSIGDKVHINSPENTALDWYYSC